MSYPKDRCDKVCPFLKYDEDYKGDICDYPRDVLEAEVDPKVPKDCPWVAWWRKNTK